MVPKKIVPFDVSSISEPKNYEAPNKEIQKYSVQEFYPLTVHHYKQSIFACIIEQPDDNKLPEPGHVAEFQDKFFFRQGIVIVTKRLVNVKDIPNPYVWVKFFAHKPGMLSAQTINREQSNLVFPTDQELTPSTIYSTLKEDQVKRLEARSLTSKVEQLLLVAAEMYSGYSEHSRPTTTSSLLEDFD